jgi:anti-sigma regulatory factor (Ser/Thr protein kinase)
VVRGASGNKTGMDGQVLRFRLRGGNDAVSAARRMLDRVAEEYEVPRYGDVRLLVSELVTNSVVHGASSHEDWVELRLRAEERCLRVEVCDQSEGWSPQPRGSADPEEPGGWGLFIVEQLAARWGQSRNGETCVWFEFDGDAVLREREACRNGVAEATAQLVRVPGGAPAVCAVCGELVTYSEGFARQETAVVHFACLNA